LVRQVGAGASNQEYLLVEAESCCQKAIALSPRFASAYACLGIIAFKRGRLFECEDLLKHARDLDPSEEGVYADLGALYSQLGRYDEAKEVLEAGRKRGRYDAQVRVELGNVYLHLDRPKDAVMVLREACAIDPLGDEPVRALSIALSKGGNALESLRVLRAAIRRQGRAVSISLRLSLCHVLTELGDKTKDMECYAEALKEARLAIAAQPRNSNAHFFAGVVCFKLGEYGTAAQHFDECHDLDSSNFEAEQNSRSAKALRWKDVGRARIGIWVGTTVGTICFGLLIALWTVYLWQPLPEAKDAARQIDAVMLLTLSPILLALVFVALLMPWLTRFKLPGGVEAEIAQPKEQISSGPSGTPILHPDTPMISAGPR
jgi:tetratricopeptide (TPR) repeat protein